MLLHVHRDHGLTFKSTQRPHRLLGTGSLGRPPPLSHLSWALSWVQVQCSLRPQRPHWGLLGAGCPGRPPPFTQLLSPPLGPASGAGLYRNKEQNFRTKSGFETRTVFYLMRLHCTVKTGWEWICLGWGGCAGEKGEGRGWRLERRKEAKGGRIGGWVMEMV